MLDGGFGEKIARYYGNSEMRVLNYGLRKEFADRYNLDELMKANRLTDKQMAEILPVYGITFYGMAEVRDFSHFCNSEIDKPD